MGVELTAERRLLSEKEFEQVRRSHYPELEGLPPDETLTLARWLRGERDRARNIIAARRRGRRGKASGTGQQSADASERGLSAKKQVYARALKRVNGRLERFRAERRREIIQANLQDALKRRKEAEPQHPSPGRTPARACARSPAGAGRSKPIRARSGGCRSS
ncbi:hypothetical protein [Azospirillum argentinense]|uniref:hypothetical protein n=1 Tax=Azospirillum argentinense TaxID=2970906 RepID=UPI001FFEB215|nr:hypothetical protein [Azospirillum argentinense]